jgi:hypothetical protein
VKLPGASLIPVPPSLLKREAVDGFAFELNLPLAAMNYSGWEKSS